MINAIMNLLLLGPIRHQFFSELQSNNHIVIHNRFLMCNICHTKCFSDSRDKRNISKRNEMRGGNLLLGEPVPQTEYLTNRNVLAT